MKIPLYVSVPAHKFSRKDDRTQRTAALNRRGDNSVCDENYIGARSLRTYGRAAGLSSARGAIAGVLLGTGVWGAVLILACRIKL